VYLRGLTIHTATGEAIAVCIASVIDLTMQHTPRLLSLFRVPAHPGKSRNITKGIFQAREVMENNCSHGKSWKSHEIPPVGREIFT